MNSFPYLAASIVGMFFRLYLLMDVFSRLSACNAQAGNIVGWEVPTSELAEQAGSFLEAWGERGKHPGQFSGPTGVAVSADGSVYVAGWGNHRIQKFQP